MIGSTASPLIPVILSGAAAEPKDPGWDDAEMDLDDFFCTTFTIESKRGETLP